MPLVTGADFGLRFPQGNRNDISPIVDALGGMIQEEKQSRLTQQKQQAETLQQAYKATALDLLSIAKKPGLTAKRGAIVDMAKRAKLRGEDTSILSDLLTYTTDDELNTAILGIAHRAGEQDKMLTEAMKAAEPVEQFEQVRNEAGDIIAQRSIASGKEISTPREGTEDGAAIDSPVQSSQFLPGGGARIVRQDGTVEVMQPTEAEIQVIKAGEQRGVDLQQQRAKGRDLGKGAAGMANKALDSTDKLRSNNLKLKKVIAEVRGGAQTGPLIDNLPSFRASTRRLLQIKNELGLDVVGSVTFGALSEGELQLALDTALPTKLEGPELITWAQEKIIAQEKLSEYLEDQAIFLSKPGNTAADWLELVRAKGQMNNAPEAPQGITEGTTATNPTTGEKIVFRGGQWVAQ
ncbi:MAG: hypothetical protein GY938_10200 [Ketobacter sp.]|nr:hypothetical protein [Ketobacter sp.]